MRSYRFTIPDTLSRGLSAGADPARSCGQHTVSSQQTYQLLDGHGRTAGHRRNAIWFETFSGRSSIFDSLWPSAAARSSRYDRLYQDDPLPDKNQRPMNMRTFTMISTLAIARRSNSSATTEISHIFAPDAAARLRPPAHLLRPWASSSTSWPDRCFYHTGPDQPPRVSPMGRPTITGPRSACGSWVVA
jgi:hypothetical protein